MTWAIFLAFIYLGLKSGLGGSVVRKLMEERGKTGITLKLAWPEIWFESSDIQPVFLESLLCATGCAGL